MLVAYAESQLSDGLSAMRLLRDDTPLFDPVAAQTPEAAPPFSGFFGLLTERQRDPVDFNTTGAFRHEGCIEVTGILRTDERQEVLSRRDGAPMPVSVFVFNEGVFGLEFLEGLSITETNARMSVGPLLIHPDLRGSGGGTLTRQDDAFADFSVAPYIASQKEDTFTKGDWAWMALDLRQGKGRQLVAVTCDAGCATYLSDFTARLLAASGPVQPIAPPLRVLAPTPDPDPDPDPAAGSVTDVPKPHADPADFVDERLSVTLIGPEDEVILLDSVRLANKLDHRSPEDRRAIRAALDTLLSDSAVDRAAALVQLIDFGVLDSGLHPYAIEVAERGYRLVLRAPPPPPPRLLTGVDLLLADPPGSAIVANCVPEAEISHPDHPSLRLPLEIDMNSAVVDPGGEEVYGRFTLSTDNTAPILSMPLRELSLRLFAPSEVRPYADARPQPSSCSLSWGGHFPETALPLADLTDDPGAPDAPDLPVSVTVTEGGRVVFAAADLTSTARPVFVLLYNATGLEDTNGMPLRPDLYPGWTHARGGRDMMSALSILASSAQTVFSRRVEDLFLLQAAGAWTREFCRPNP